MLGWQHEKKRQTNLRGYQRGCVLGGGQDSMSTDINQQVLKSLRLAIPAGSSALSANMGSGLFQIIRFRFVASINNGISHNEPKRL
jgi:hypothetical protein